VSQSAVSRAFSPGGHPLIAEPTRQRVLAAARELSYSPNPIARSLNTGRSAIVALILGDLANPFYGQVLQRFSDVLQGMGRQLLVFTVPARADADEALRRVLSFQVEGVIITAAQLSTSMARTCMDRGIPVVMFNRYIPSLDAACVRCDNHAGGGAVARAMLAAGIDRFALLTGDAQATASNERAGGFKDVLRAAGVSPGAIIERACPTTYEGGFVAGRALGRSRRRPRGLFCVTDITAMGAMDAIRFDLGLRIPEDIAVAGFGDVLESARASYRLTTLRQPMEAMVLHAVRLLSLDERTPSVREQVVLPVDLIFRESLVAPVASMRTDQAG